MAWYVIAIQMIPRVCDYLYITKIRSMSRTFAKLYLFRNDKIIMIDDIYYRQMILLQQLWLNRQFCIVLWKRQRNGTIQSAFFSVKWKLVFAHNRLHYRRITATILLWKFFFMFLFSAFFKKKSIIAIIESVRNFCCRCKMTLNTY